MRTIELRVGLDDAYGRAAARGVIRYAKERGDWNLYGAVSRDFSGQDADGSALTRRPDGIIARVESPEAARELAALGIPVVDIAGAFPFSGAASAPFLESNNDDFLTGLRAGEYLRGIGFASFAFCGVGRAEWSAKRRKGFAEAIGREDARLPAFERPLQWWKELREGTDELEDFLRSLPSPSALYACNDRAGLKTAEACRRRGIAVPDQLAILGTDDEDLICELAAPSLSSVRLDCEGIGRAAARMLEDVLDGRNPERSVRVMPREIVERESTRTAVADDELASRALSWIRTNAPRGVDAGDLAAAFPLSRRSLERRFKAAWGKSPHEAIVEARVERAKGLLASTSMTLDEVARESGFGALQRFHIAFKRTEGVSPGAWRRERRSGPR